MLARIVPFMLLRRRVGQFNQDILALEPRKVIQSAGSFISAVNLTVDLLNLTREDLTHIGIPPLNIWNIMVRDLEHEWWTFFLLASISATRLTLAMLSVLFATDQRKADMFARAQGAAFAPPVASFWSENLYKRLLIG
jgi:hypothetical protein